MQFLDAAKRQSLGTAFRKFFCSVVSLASSVSGRLKFFCSIAPLASRILQGLEVLESLQSITKHWSAMSLCGILGLKAFSVLF